MTYEELLDFVKDDNRNVLVWGTAYSQNIVMKLRVQPQTTLLLYDSTSANAAEQELLHYAKFEAAGFYSHATQTLYDLSYFILSHLNTKEVKTEESSQLTKNMYNLLSQKVAELAIARFPEDKTVSLEKHLYEEQAWKAFMKGETPAKICFHLALTNLYLKDMDIDKFLTNNEEWITEKAQKYFDEHAEQLQKEVLTFYHIRSQLAKLEADTKGRHYIIRAIRDCITDQKTVHVEIFKNGTAFAFKTEASALKNPNGEYSNYSIEFKARKEYNALFKGWNNDYRAEEIVKITHGKKVLYEAVK